MSAAALIIAITFVFIALCVIASELGRIADELERDGTYRRVPNDHATDVEDKVGAPAPIPIHRRPRKVDDPPERDR